MLRVAIFPGHTTVTPSYGNSQVPGKVFRPSTLETLDSRGACAALTPQNLKRKVFSQPKLSPPREVFDVHPKLSTMRAVLHTAQTLNPKSNSRCHLPRDPDTPEFRNIA